MFSCIFLLRDLFARLRCQYLTDVVVNFLLMKMSWKFRLTAMSMMRRLVGVVALFILFSSRTCLLYIFFVYCAAFGFSFIWSACVGWCNVCHCQLLHTTHIHTHMYKYGLCAHSFNSAVSHPFFHSLSARNWIDIKKWEMKFAICATVRISLLLFCTSMQANWMNDVIKMS